LARIENGITDAANGEKRVTIFGAAVVDFNSKNANEADFSCKSVPGKVKVTVGGVGRNVAQVCHQKGVKSVLVANISNDSHGKLVKNDMIRRGMSLDGLVMVDDRSTPVYTATFDHVGELLVATADMELAESAIANLEKFKTNSNFIVMDGNLGIETMKEICQSTTPILFEPTSVWKSSKIFKLGKWINNVKFITPDYDEGVEMSDWIDGKVDLPEIQSIPIAHQFASDIMSKLLFQFPNVILKCGVNGCVVGTSRPSSRNCTTGKQPHPEISITHIKPTRKVDAVSVSGAGDSLVGVVSSLLSAEEYPSFVSHKRLVEIVTEGMEAAQLTCEVDGISTDIK
jgi:sugar/nucleoside kinase (ribokinase family)